jgi:predicted Zn-dependent peptidase
VLVALSGKLPSSETKALALVKKYFHNIPLGQGKPKLKTREKQIKPNLLIQKKSTEQTHLWLGFRAFNTFDLRQYTLEVLNAVLDAGMSSRLFQLLREKLGLAYYVNSWFSLKTDTGWWAVSAGVNNGRVLEAISHILKEFRSFKISRLDEAEVKKAKNCLIGRLSLSSENVHAVAADYASQALLKNQIISLEEHLKKIKDVRFSEVKKLAEELIKPQFLNLALLGPIKEDQKIKKLLGSFIN